MKHQTTIAGMPLDTVLAFQDVLAAHQIKDPKALNDRLGKADRDAKELKRLRAEAGRVRVVDSRNLSRVLGTIQPPGVAGPRISFAVRPSLSAAMHDPFMAQPVAFEFSRVDMEWDMGSCDGPQLKTSAPLELLMKLDLFRLPGETAQQADERRFYSR